MKLYKLPFLCLALSLVWLANLPMAQAAPKDPPYEQVTPPQPLNNQEGKLEVVELFWYTCPHCYHFEAYLEPWVKNLPKDVVFMQVPAVFGSDRGLELAQAFYTAEALGILGKVHKPIFEAIQKDKKQLKTMEDFYPIFAKEGVSKEDFMNTASSFSVDMQVRNAQRLTARYGITAVPSVVVQGKYRVTSDLTDGYENMFKVINNLLDRDRLAAAVTTKAEAAPAAAPAKAEAAAAAPAVQPEQPEK